MLFKKLKWNIGTFFINGTLPWDDASSQFTKSFHPLLPRDIFTGNKRSRQTPAPYADKVEVLQVSPLRVKVTYRLLSLALSLSLASSTVHLLVPRSILSFSLATFHLRGLLAQVVSCGGLRCCLTSSLTSHTTKHRERLVCALGEYKNILIV